VGTTIKGRVGRESERTPTVGFPSARVPTLGPPSPLIGGREIRERVIWLSCFLTLQYQSASFNPRSRSPAPHTFNDRRVGLGYQPRQSVWFAYVRTRWVGLLVM